ncbi:MAG: hypothetical protein RIB46_22030 [Pseudomonadales bacterium]
MTLRHAGFLLLAAAINLLVAPSGLARELSATDRQLLEEFREQLESLDAKPSSQLKQINPESLLFVAYSINCPIHEKLVENLTTSALNRARIRPVPIERDLNDRELLLSVSATCVDVSGDGRLLVFWAQAEFMSSYAEANGNVILPGGSIWAGLFGESDFIAVVTELISSQVESYVVSNFN